MIDWNIIEYLAGQEKLRQNDNQTRTCYITSKLVLQYEENKVPYSQGTFENIILEEMPSQYPLGLDGEIIMKHRMLYKVKMPVELLPCFMEVIRRIHTVEYPQIRVESETIIWKYDWEHPWEMMCL